MALPEGTRRALGDLSSNMYSSHPPAAHAIVRMQLGAIKLNITPNKSKKEG
jgi:hypothetical protein